MTPPSKKEAILNAIISWSSLKELAQFAIQRHGYGNTDGGFGVIYPDQSGDQESTSNESDIPEGYIEVYGFWGNPDGYEMLVTEAEYLDELAAQLKSKGYEKEYGQLIHLKKKMTDTDDKKYQ